MKFELLEFSPLFTLLLSWLVVPTERNRLQGETYIGASSATVSNSSSAH